MSSVAELVKDEKRAQQRRLNEYERERLAEKKKESSKQFSAEVAYIIKQFEYNAFNINSTNKDVAKFILDYKGVHFITRSRDLEQTMPGYVYVKPFMGALKFNKSDNAGKKNITASSKYNKWKKALEDKFGVKIYISRDYTYQERYSNSGYAQPSDEIFCGVRAVVVLNKD